MNTLHSFALLVLTIIILAGYSAPEAYSQTSSRYLADAVPMMQCEGSAVRIANPFYRFTTKLTYKGDIKNDTATGNGTAVWMYGSDTIMVFTGEFLGGKMHGVGIAQYPLMGKVYKGKWQEGVPLGFFEKDSSPADRVFSPPPQSPAAEDVRNGEYIPTSGEFTALEIAPDVDFTSIMKNLLYPEAARLLSVEQVINARCLIDKRGKVIAISDDTGPTASVILFPVAFLTLWETTFQPAVQKGNPIYCWVTVPIKFKLR